MSAPNRSAIWKAPLASFLVYLLPIVTVHILIPWGMILAMEISRGRGDGEALWVAADVALALGLQAAAGLLWFWYFRAPSWKRLGAVFATVPLFFAALQWLYLIVIPTWFLVEADIKAGKTPWVQQCSVPGHYLAAIKTPPALALANASEAWVAEVKSSRLGILRMPECGVLPVNLKWSNVNPRLASVAPGGRVVYATYERPTNAESWWYVGGPNQEPLQLEKPERTDRQQPILSSDGQWVGWLQRISGGPGRSQMQAILQNPLSGKELAVGLPRYPSGRFRLLSADLEAPSLFLEYDYRQFLRVGLDGSVLEEPWKPAGVKASGESLLRLADGWVAWDSYKDRGSYMVSWSVAKGVGQHRVLKGRRIRSLATDRDGRYVAVSVTIRLNIGNIQDAVYVLQTSDGSAVFRKYLPRYSRSQVAFFGSEFFAYSETRPRPGAVHVLRLPQ